MKRPKLCTTDRLSSSASIHNPAANEPVTVGIKPSAAIIFGLHTKYAITLSQVAVKETSTAPVAALPAC
jgi:hypothetical protein